MNAVSEKSAWMSDMEAAAARDLAALERHLPPHKRAPVKNSGDGGNSGDGALHNGSSVPADKGRNGDMGTGPAPASDSGAESAAVAGEDRPRAEAPAEPAHFELLEHSDGKRAPGVYWVGIVTDKKTGEVLCNAEPEWICGPLKIEARTRDAQGSSWGRLLVFRDHDGREHRWTCPQAMHAGNGDELRAVLLREGLAITTNPAQRRRVADYIQMAQTEVTARCVDRTGWHGDVFVLPRETIGDSEAEPVLFQAATIDGVTLGQAGTLAGWIETVAAPCAGNTRLVLAVCIGFAGPCVGLMGAEGGGIHLRGPSSCGKSTALAVAASLYGAPQQYARTWRATDNGLEGVAAIHSDLLLVLDELGQLEPRHAGQVAYMLANGQGKARSHRDGSPRATAQWRLVFLSAGEIGLAELVTQSGGKVRPGQEVRVIDLPADTGAGVGLFDRVPRGTPAGAFADALKVASATHHGHALPAFLNALVADPAKARETLRALRDGIAAALPPPGSSGQVKRVADRFALIAAAGELATAYKLTGWATGEAERAVKACFSAWLEARGTAGNGESAAVLAQVRNFLEANAEARFTRWDAPESGPRTVNRAGFRKRDVDGDEFYIEVECFRRDVCAGFDHAAAARALADAGALDMDRDGRPTKKVRLPDGRNTRMYVVTAALWNEAEIEALS